MSVPKGGELGFECRSPLRFDSKRALRFVQLGGECGVAGTQRTNRASIFVLAYAPLELRESNLGLPSASQPILQVPHLSLMRFGETAMLHLPFRHPAARSRELLGQLAPLVFQRTQPPNVRPTRRAGQMGEHVHLSERLHHQGAGGAGMRHERPIRSGHVAFGQGATPELTDLRLGLRTAEALDRAPELPFQNLLNRLRLPPLLPRELHEVTVNSVLAFVRLESNPGLCGNLAELDEAETRSQNRTVVPVPDLPEHAAARGLNCLRRGGAVVAPVVSGVAGGRSPLPIEPPTGCSPRSIIVRPRPDTLGGFEPWEDSNGGTGVPRSPGNPLPVCNAS